MEKNIEMFVNRKIKTLKIHEDIVAFSDEIYADNELINKKEGLSLKETIDDIKLFDKIVELDEKTFFVVPKIILETIRSNSKFEIRTSANPYTAFLNYPDRFIVLKKDSDGFIRTMTDDYIPKAVFFELNSKEYNLKALMNYIKLKPSRFYIISSSDTSISLDWIPDNKEYYRFILESGKRKTAERISGIDRFKI